MTIKEKVHKLLEDLPEETTYDEIIDSVTRLKRQDDLDPRASMEAYLDAARYDDEELSPETLEAIKTGLEESQRGEVFSREEIIREFDLG